MTLNDMDNTLSNETTEKYEAPASMEYWDNFTTFGTEKINDSPLDESRAYKLRLAYEELISNIIRYANNTPLKEKGITKLEVSLTVKTIDSQPWLILQTKDNGVQFDPQFYHRSPVDTEKPVAERQIGGLGIFLIEQSVDKATYEWINNQNIYQLKMNCLTNKDEE